jgi:hypothetical protein
LGWGATWWPSAPLPLPFCLFLFLASLAWRCGARYAAVRCSVCGGARYACLLRAQVWLWTRGATGDADGYADGQKQGEMLPRLRGGVYAECVKYTSLFLCHTLPPLPHTRTSPPFTHTRIQSFSKYRSKVQTRVPEKGREAGEGEVAWRARRETCLRSLF